MKILFALAFLFGAALSTASVPAPFVSKSFINIPEVFKTMASQTLRDPTGPLIGTWQGLLSTLYVSTPSGQFICLPVGQPATSPVTLTVDGTFAEISYPGGSYVINGQTYYLQPLHEQWKIQNYQNGWLQVKTNTNANKCTLTQLSPAADQLFMINNVIDPVSCPQRGQQMFCGSAGVFNQISLRKTGPPPPRGCFASLQQCQNYQPCAQYGIKCYVVPNNPSAPYCC